MTPPLLSLLGFSAWTLLLMAATVGIPRVLAVRARTAAPRSFQADVPHGSERYRRSMRAHLNCVENLPVFGALVLIAAHVGPGDRLFQALAVTMLPARIAQSITHVLSGSNWATTIRAGFFTIQLVCMLAMAGLIARHALH